MTRRKNKKQKTNKPTHTNAPATTPITPKTPTNNFGGVSTGAPAKTSYTQTTYTKQDCHKGNTPIYKEPNGGTLYIGGWANKAEFDWNTHVIDLTGSEHKYWDIPIAYDEQSKAFLPFLMKAYAGWLSLPFPDYGTPSGLKTKEQWIGITDTIRGILQKGNDVLVACHAGHGRSGLFCSIVGYLLNAQDDPTWANPVEKLRSIHCEEAVETFSQEKFVYEILGLRLSPKHTYDDDFLYYGRGSSIGYNGDPGYVGTSTFEFCPICGAQSIYVANYGMCMGCRDRYKAIAPAKSDLTLKDIESRGVIEHNCKNERCMGIWKASKCGHVVHDQIIYEGLCEECFQRQEEALVEGDDDHQKVCAMCGEETLSSEKYGICYDCASAMVSSNTITDVHNTITDPYAFIPHSHCENETLCVGIVRADVCLHVVHNREVEAGLCQECSKKKEAA